MAEGQRAFFVVSWNENYIRWWIYFRDTELFLYAAVPLINYWYSSDLACHWFFNTSVR